MPDRPKPIAVPPFRAAAVSGRGPDELGRYYWRVTRGGARGDDVSVEALGGARWLTEQHAARVLREYAERVRAPKRRTVGELLARWAAMVERTANSERTAKIARGAATRLSADELGGLELHRLDVAALTQARDRLLRSYASATVQLDLGRLGAAWRWAAREGVTLPPWPGVRVTVYETRAKPVPRDAEVDAVLAALDGWARVAYLVLVETGARPGEVMSLRLEDVDLEQGLLRVAGKRTRRAGPGARRTVPIDPTGEAASALRGWCADRLPGSLWPPVEAHALWAAIHRACDRAGVRHMSPTAWRRRADVRLIGASLLSELPALMDHSLAQAMKSYNRPESDAVRAAGAVLRRGATQPRHSDQDIGQKRRKSGAG